MRIAWVAALLLVALPASLGAAEDLAQMEGRLPATQGLERARLLARLVEAARSDAPQRALVWGEEALRLFARYPDAASEVATLNEMAWAHMSLGEREPAERRAQEGLKLAERHGDQAGRARALNNLGAIARRWADPERAVEMFEQSLALYRELGLEAQVANALNNLGVVHAFDLADYERALGFQLQALEVNERLGNRAGRAQSLNNIGVVQARLGDHVRALQYFDAALALRRALGLRAGQAGTLHNIGDSHRALAQWDAALAFHEQALALREEIGERVSLPGSLTAIGIIQTERGDYARAESALARAQALAEAQGSSRERLDSLLARAALDRRRGRNTRAEVAARQALALAGETAAPESARRALEELALVMEAAGRPAEALAFHKRFKRQSDEILNSEKARRLASLESRYQAARQEREIESLERERAEQALELEQRAAQRNGIAFVALAFAAAGLALFRRHRELGALSRRLAELSTTDSLTGLRNRRWLNQSVEGDVATCLRRYRDEAAAADADLVFTLVDLDLFKRVNDAHGHAAGDSLLLQVSDLLRVICRASDSLVRWGGEEFLVVSRFVSRREAPALAERIRGAVEAHPFALADGSRLHITCSLGYAPFPLDPKAPGEAGWEQVIALADEALYAAKRAGRNAWVGLSAGPPKAGEGSGDGWRRDLRERLSRGELAMQSSLPGPRIAFGGEGDRYCT